MMIPFSPPRIDQAIIDEVTDTLKSGWITTGPKTKQFEKELKHYCHCKSAVCVNSGTAGMEIVLRWYGVKEGDEVIIPAYTYTSTASVVIHCGATPVMVDIGSDFNIDPEKMRSAVTARTKAIIPVDVGGFPCDYDRIYEVINDGRVRSMFRPDGENQERLGRILIMSDAAHSLGARSGNYRAGALSDVSVFSFHAVKNLTTAEGGAIALNLPDEFDHEELYKYFNTLILHGQTKDALTKLKNGNWRYDVIEPGYKCNMTDIQASIGLVELRRYEDDTLPRREEICRYYADAFSEKQWAIVPEQSDDHRTSSFHLFQLRIAGITEPERDEIIRSITEKGVSVNVHYVPLPMLSAYKNRGYDIKDFPSSFEKYLNEISLPVYYDLSDEQLAIVVNAVVNSVESVLVRQKAQ